MHYYMPEISWHDRGAIMAVHFHPGIPSPSRYKVVTCSIRQEIRIWTLCFDCSDDCSKPALSVDFIANLGGYHRSAVNLVRFSPRGEMIASGDSDGVMVIWQLRASSESTPATEIFSTSEDMPPNKENWVRLRTLNHERDICYLMWSPDAAMIASSSIDDTLAVHCVNTGRRLWSHRHFRRVPNGIAWDPRGKYLIVLSAERKMDILDAVKGTRLRLVQTVDFPRDETLNATEIPAGTCKMFHDDQLMSFVRSADFSPDGQLLIVPSGHLEVGKKNVYTNYVFSRANLEKPIAILPSAFPTFIARCCPVAFELRVESRENSFIDLPYRLVWALATNTSIALYDSQHATAFSYIDNIHYNSLTDIQWSSDGRVLLIASLEGYCSFLLFNEEEIGIPLVELPVPPPSPQLIGNSSKKTPRRVKTAKATTPPPQRTSASASNGGLLRYLMKTPTTEKAETETTKETEENETRTSQEKGAMKKTGKRVQLITLAD